MQAADKSDAVLIAVTREGRIYLNNTQMKAEDLVPKVKDMLTNRLDKECFLRADQRAKYQTVLDVVQSLQSSGVDQLGLLTEQVEGRRPATRVAQ
jgi:biopolymer transport protein ExbD/biopolymer transport protein TolR